MVQRLIEVDMEKLKAVMHFIISKCGNLENFGKTLLYKMLYFSDFDFYEIYERSITGEQYFRLQFGPAPSHFDNALVELEKEGAIDKIEGNYMGKPQERFLSLKEPSQSPLCGDEIKVIEKAIKKLSGMNANQVSAYSHGDIPWKATKENDKIDYELVFYRNDTYSVRDNGESESDD